MGIYTEFYNFGMDEKTKKPDGTITYDVVDASNQTVMSQTETSRMQPYRMPLRSLSLTSREKAASAEFSNIVRAGLVPGKYTLKLTVHGQAQERRASLRLRNLR
jgi:uncharacterized glyoxalase superfamily protein PhnB